MAPPPPSPRLRRATTAGWLVTAPLAALAAARLVRYDDHLVLSAANAGTTFVYLPAYGALAAGIAGRRRGLTAVAGSVVAAHMAWMAPELRRARRLAPDADKAPRLRVVSSNIRFNSRDSTALGEELAAAEPDILFLQELGPDHLRMLKAAGTFDRYPYSFVGARKGSFGGGIWSRYPLSEEDPWEVNGHPFARAAVTVHGTTIRLFNIHTKAPSRAWAILRWKEQLAALVEEVGVDDRPLIMAGDFNSTWGHKPFRELLATGLRDAHVEVGRGLARTWPGHWRLPAVVRLDHVLVSSDFNVLEVRELNARTSDHRPVVADLTVPPSGPGSPA